MYTIRGNFADAISLYYMEEGDGFPLVLLHGNGESSEYFKNQIPFFSKEFRVLAVDTRGHGKSPRGTAPFTLDQFAEDLKQFLDIHKITKCHLLGYSDGANIALLFALKYPDYIDKLILNGGNLSDKGIKTYAQFLVCIGYGLVSLIAVFCKKVIFKKEILGLMIGQPNITTELLHNLQMPVLVIAGTNDIVKDIHTRLIAKSIPNARLSIISGGHSIAEENSETFNNEIRTFLH